MRPAVGSITRSRQRPSVVLPEPDSPTIPSVSSELDLDRHVVDRLHRAARGGPKYIFRLLHLDDRRLLGGDRRALAADLGLLLELQHRADQHFGVGVLRRMEDRLDRPALHHLALVHDQHVVGDLGHHAHVVGDEHHAHAVLGLQALDQVEDLRLGGDVERGGRLVGDQQGRIAGERHGDHGALAHAAGELERVAVDRALRVGDLDLPQQIDRALARGLLAHAPVQLQHLDDLVADGVHRRERGHRLLEDHRDLFAAHGADGAALRAQLGEIDDRAIVLGEHHRAGHDAAGRIDDLQDRARHHALARAAFADDRERAAAHDVERHAVDRLHDAVAHRKMRRQVAHLQDRRAVIAGARLRLGRVM